jgi:lipopolysaccharide transport system permease protein
VLLNDTPARSRAQRPRTSAALVLSHRHLLGRVAVGELRKRYAGSLAGVGWAIILPGLVLGIYALIYLAIFQIKVPGLPATDYVLYICAGLVPFLTVAEVLGLGASAVVANKAVLNNTVFPIDLAPVVTVLISQASMAAGLGIVLIGATATGRLGPAALAVPIFWGLLVLFLIGVTWIVSLITVAVRDLQVAMTAIVMILLVASPIAYTRSMVPAGLEPLLTVNPVAHFVIAFQEAIVIDRLPSVGAWAVLMALGLGTFFVGGWFFSRAKNAMIDFL